MAKASTLRSIVTVRRTTCWILKRTLSPFLTLRVRWVEMRGEGRVQQAAIVLATFMGVAMRMRQGANSDTLTVSLETSLESPPARCPPTLFKSPSRYALIVRSYIVDHGVFRKGIRVTFFSSESIMTSGKSITMIVSFDFRKSHCFHRCYCC